MCSADGYESVEGFPYLLLTVALLLPSSFHGDIKTLDDIVWNVYNN
jgi:hypothetical protein